MAKNVVLPCFCKKQIGKDYFSMGLNKNDLGIA
jgi:hypothetical protein